MYFNSLSSSGYENELIIINFNKVEPQLENARIGTRFFHFYFDTWNEKVNFSNCTINTLTGSEDWNRTITNAYSRNYVLTGFSENSDITSDDASYAISPTVFGNPNDYQTLYWKVNGNREFLYFNYVNAEGAASIYPAHPYPKIEKINNNVIRVSGCLVPTTGFDGVVDYDTFKKNIKYTNFSSLTSLSNILQSSSANHIPYISKRRINYTLGSNKNFVRDFYIPNIGKNIIANSLKIEVPVLTSRVYTEISDDGGFNLTFTTGDVTYQPTNIPSTLINLSCLPFEDLSGLGISYPYTTRQNSKFNPRTGQLWLYFNAPLWIEPSAPITVSYETSSFQQNINFTKPIPANSNYWEISASNVHPVSAGIYFYNYKFSKGTSFSSAGSDAFTVSFLPSSFVTNIAYSEVTVSSVMTDNYYQTNFTIDDSTGTRMVKRFVEQTDDDTLSARHVNSGAIYKNNQWMPANGSIILFNNGVGNRHTVKIQLSAFTGAIYEEQNEIEFLLNRNDIVFEPLITESGSSSATINTIIYPTPSEDFGFKWSANPPENVVFRTIEGEVIEQNTFYPYLLDVQVQYLGVDKTQIVVYSEEYETSASSFWFPPSSVVNDIYLEIKGSINDKNETGTGTISAFCNRNGRSYRVPTDSNIIWNEIANDNRGAITFGTRTDNLLIKEGTVYSGSNEYSLTNVTVSSIPVLQDPKYILFDVSCNLFRNDFALNANKLFLYIEFPAGNLLSMSGTSALYSNVPLFNSIASRNVVFSNSAHITLSAIYPDLVMPSFGNLSGISWTIIKSNYPFSSGSTTYNNISGDVLTFTLSTVSACVVLNGLNAKPFEGNFNKNYNFSDTICFYNLSTLTPFNYIAFPENQYNPTKTAASFYPQIEYCNANARNVFDLYTNSQGMTSYKPCHTENFYFSASPGFDNYVWKIGNINVRSFDNAIVVPVSYKDVSANNSVTVSAYNNIFLEGDPVTIYNFASSNNSNVYRQPITFLDFPSPTVSIEIDNTIINVDYYSNLPTLIATVDLENFTISDYTFNIVLSSKDFLQTTLVQNNANVFNKLLKIGIENTDYIINENSFNECAVYLSGNVGVTINGFDFCPSYTAVSSNIVYLSAYNGPNLELYCNKNIVSSGEIVTFYNGSNKNFISSPLIKFDSFIFDNGEGTISNPLTSSLYFTTTYSTEGSKTPSLTGVLNTGETYIQTWDKLVVVKDSFQEYDSSITREFYETLKMPYTLEDIRVKPNDWQYASTINKSLEKLKTNFSYLSSVCSVNNINFPKAYGGYLGNRFGNFKWHTKYSTSNVQPTIFHDLRSVQFCNDKIICLNGNKLEIYNISENPSLLYSINRINDAEILENPTTLYYDESINRLYLLDSGKQIMFVCYFDIDNPSDINLTHYWGGIGGRTDRTKLNNPIDFCLDSDKNLYIVDYDSYIIKVYNKNLNWIRNIELAEFSSTNRPQSISTKNNLLSITTENGVTFLTDIFGNIAQKIEDVGSSNSVLNFIHQGIIYIINGQYLKKYTINNTYIAEYFFDDKIVDVVFDEHHGYVVFKDYILKFVDFIEIDKVINDNETLSGFSWNSIYVNENEFITDYIFNDSFKKTFDNIVILNGRIDKKLFVDYNQFYKVINQSTSAYSPLAITEYPILLATNEPVLYDTINRGIEYLYSNLEELKFNIDATFSIPNNNEDLKWRWNYHYIDGIQIPTLEKNPVSWREMSSSKLIGNTQLSSFSAWYVIREGAYGNHSQICWNYIQTQNNSLFPLTWDDTTFNNISGHIFTWEDLEKDCCRLPDYIFADCVSAC